MYHRICLSIFALGLVFSSPSFAQELQTYELTLKDAAFSPAEIRVPAGKAFMIKFNNANSAPAELESLEMKVEKIVPANSTIMVRVRELEPGSYPFVDEFQEDIAKGVVIAE